MALIKKPIHLMIDLVPRTSYYRGIIAGAARYCVEHPHVRLRLPSSEFELIGNNEWIDGVIAIVRETEGETPAAKYNRPLVNISGILESVPFPTVAVDNRAAGRLAADHLLAQGYAHMAYHMEGAVYFSRERFAGFRDRLAEVKRTCAVFDTHVPTDHPDGLRGATRVWLESLPKPLGLFTHTDNRAAMLIDICHDIGLTIPDQVGVIGADDDVLIAAMTIPTLTSIDLSADVIGYRATQMVIDLIDGKRVTSKPEQVPPRGVVQRQSTQPAFLDDEMLGRAMAFIQAHATDPISIEHVLDAVPVSRRSLERRFREGIGRGPGEEIRRVQIEKAKKLLLETNQKLTQVADAVGYAQFRNFATAFSRSTGMSPSKYRASFRLK